MRRVLGVAGVCTLAFAFASMPSAHAAPTPVAPSGLLTAVQPDLAQMRSELDHAVAPEVAQPRVVHPNVVTSVTVNDPAGDVPDARGDIVTATSNKDSISETFTMTMATPDDPLSDANWLSPDTFGSWFADTNFDGTPDRIILLIRDPMVAQLDVGLFPAAGGNLLCLGTGNFDGTKLSARLGSSCPSLHAYKWAAAMLYLNNEDDAPNFPALSPTTPAVRSGYFMLGAAGHVYGFGNAPEFGGNVPSATSMATIPDGTGTYVVDSAGHVFTQGRAHYHGGTPALQPGEMITTMSVTPDAGGYWLFSNRGRAFRFGNAASHGDLSGKALNGPIIASVATPDGGGYYMVGSDGGIFTFGNAKFRGSEGGKPLNAPVVGIAPTPDNKGYWLVASDGGVFTFGDAVFRGSMGGKPLNAPVHGMVAYGNGYLLVASDGGVFDFSNKAFLGSLGGQHLPAPIVDIVAFAVNPV